MTQTSTPQEYLNNVLVSDSIYRNDSLWLINHLKEKIRDRSGSFYNKEYYDSTQLLIDSIIYSLDKDKIAFFVIAENPMHRRLNKLPSDEKHVYYYNAFCYLGIRLDRTHTWTTKWFNTFNITNSKDLKKASEYIRWMYFNELVTVRDTGGASAFKYNVDDIRFWSGPAWKELF